MLAVARLEPRVSAAAETGPSPDSVPGQGLGTITGGCFATTLSSVEVARAQLVVDFGARLPAIRVEAVALVGLGRCCRPDGRRRGAGAVRPHRLRLASRGGRALRWLHRRL